VALLYKRKLAQNLLFILDPIGRRILVAIAKKQPIDYIEAVDGQDALEKFESFKPDASKHPFQTRQCPF